ncbi:MAG: hypothetical protein ABSG43_18845 [Solirubrobacteraceae bacterium]
MIRWVTGSHRLRPKCSARSTWAWRSTLNKRINNHLSGNGSDLRQRLHHAKPTSVDMLDLSITWMAAPEPEEDLEQQAATPVEYSDVTLDEKDEQDEGDVAPIQRRTYKVGSELDLNLKAAESLLIRLAMPMFNE